MPIYEYRCDNCEHEMEAMQKMSAPPKRKCPVCGRMKLKKLISAGSFILKGEGFYKPSQE